MGMPDILINGVWPFEQNGNLQSMTKIIMDMKFSKTWTKGLRGEAV